MRKLKERKEKHEEMWNERAELKKKTGKSEL